MKLKIGEFVSKVSPEGRSAKTSIKEEWFDTSPLKFSDIQGNCLDVSFHKWPKFTKKYDLFEVFYGSDGTLEGDEVEPSVLWKPDPQKFYLPFSSAFKTYPIQEDHLQVFQESYNKQKIQAKESTKDLGTLEWMVFWTDWALENCEFPTIGFF